MTEIIANTAQDALSRLLSATKPSKKGVDINTNDMTLEELALLVQTERINSLEKQMKDKVGVIKERQAKVRFLHDLISTINKAIDKKGKLDISKKQELKDMLKRAQDEMGIDIDSSKTLWSTDEKDRLIETIKLSCEDLNSENQMDLQDTQMLMTQRFEMYEMTKSIMKPLHEDKINKARKMAT